MKGLRWLALPLLAAACSSSGSGTPAPGGDALAYTMPTSGPLHYTVADTAVVTMDIMGNGVQINVQSRAVVGLALDRAGDALSGTVTFDSLAGGMSSTMGPGTSLGDSDRPGPTGLTVTPRGVVTITDRPEMSGPLAQVLGSTSYVQRLFLRVPGRAVAPGATWVDTVSVSEEAAGMNTVVHSIITSTLRGDTMVAGMRLLAIDSKIDATQQVSGNNQGVEVHQNIAGIVNAVSMWDPARGVLVERSEQGTLTGSMELPAMGMSGLPVNVRQSQVIRLRR